MCLNTNLSLFRFYLSIRHATYLLVSSLTGMIIYLWNVVFLILIIVKIKRVQAEMQAFQQEKSEVTIYPFFFPPS